MCNDRASTGRDNDDFHVDVDVPSSASTSRESHPRDVEAVAWAFVPPFPRDITASARAMRDREHLCDVHYFSTGGTHELVVDEHGAIAYTGGGCVAFGVGAVLAPSTHARPDEPVLAYMNAGAVIADTGVLRLANVFVSIGADALVVLPQRVPASLSNSDDVYRWSTECLAGGDGSVLGVLHAFVERAGRWPQLPEAISDIGRELKVDDSKAMAAIERLRRHAVLVRLADSYGLTPHGRAILVRFTASSGRSTE